MSINKNTLVLSDVDECELNQNLCLNGQCINSIGSFSCRCNSGFSVKRGTPGCTGKNLIYIRGTGSINMRKFLLQ